MALPTVGIGNSYRFSEDDIPELIKPLVAGIHEGNSEKVHGLISEIKSKRKEKDLQNVSLEQETILHRAVKMRASKEIISALITVCPELLIECRLNSEVYRGQTALHIAITGRDIEVADELLRKGKELGVIGDILGTCATGSRFGNTVMLGELPLLVAALTLNVKVLERVLEYGAEIDVQNSRGDNICHCLIQYAHLYPEKLTDIMSIVEHLANVTHDKVETKSSTTVNKGSNCKSSVKSCQQINHIWLTPNNDGLNPLKLAAKLGQYAIFKFIMELKGVYCYVNSEDGLFDVELYDVTDIDASSDFKLRDIFQWIDPQPVDKMNYQKDNLNPKPVTTCKVPTLEMIFESDSATAFKFIEMSPLRYVINRKWEFYKWFFLVWGIMHMLFMVGFTAYAMRRSTVESTVTDRNVYKIGDDLFVTVYAMLSLVFSFLYIAQEVIRIVKGHMPWTISHVINCYHNGPLRIVLLTFALTIIADFIWRLSDDKYADYLLVCSMIVGWWFLVFFLRGFRQFSFFTVMIQKVLVGDMFRFSIVIGMELVAFTTGILIAFRGTTKLTGDIPENENVYEFGKLMMAMFKMMFGFTSLDVLFDAPSPWFAACIYVAFVLLTYVLMINSLIAMMSNTCSLVSQNRDMQYRVQQLSIILFFESIFPACCLRMVGQPRVCDWYDLNTKQITKRNRSFMEVRSLHEVTKSKSRHRVNADTMLETIFHTIKSIQLPKIGVFEDNAEMENEHGPLEVHRSNVHNNPDSNSGDTEDPDRVSKRKHKKKKRKHQKHRDEPKEEITYDNVTDADDTTKERRVSYSCPVDSHRLTSVEHI